MLVSVEYRFGNMKIDRKNFMVIYERQHPTMYLDNVEANTASAKFGKHYYLMVGTVTEYNDVSWSLITVKFSSTRRNFWMLFFSSVEWFGAMWLKYKNMWNERCG